MQGKLALNLPEFEYRLEHRQNKPYIFDIIRKKYVKLDPEEWVRQHFIHYLINNSYPASLIKIEAGHQFNFMQKRTDIVAYDRDINPFLLVECKSPDIQLSQKVFEQAANYNRSLKAPMLAISNGLQHFFSHIDFKNGSYQMLDNLPDFPSNN